MKCQNCDKEFTEDKDFYNRLNIPEPSFCASCRLQRRILVSNDRALYKIPCEMCKKQGISMYHKDKVFPVYCIDCWRSDQCDVLDYGADYDFKKPFFEQLKELKLKVPRMILIQQGEMKDSQ